jgi:hypothetical protein
MRPTRREHARLESTTRLPRRNLQPVAELDPSNPVDRVVPMGSGAPASRSALRMAPVAGTPRCSIAAAWATEC